MDRATAASSTTGSLATRWTQIGALHSHDAEHAWQWFVGRYRPFVRGILRTLLPPVRADAAEEEFWGYVFLSGALKRADRDRRFRAFLSGIVRNFARSWTRTKALPLAEEEKVNALHANHDHADPEVELWVENVIANALATLREENPVTAQAIERFYGVADTGSADTPASASEVAELLGNTTQGVYMLLYRGRKRLRFLLEEELREGCQDEAAFDEELRILLRLAGRKAPGLLILGKEPV
jgi:DNA-directed RNA polymerase specialized sigma24 family protein